MHWDVLHLYAEMLNALRECRAKHGGVDAVGVDTWGVDFALLGRGGTLLGADRVGTTPGLDCGGATPGADRGGTTPGFDCGGTPPGLDRGGARPGNGPGVPDREPGTVRVTFEPALERGGRPGIPPLDRPGSPGIDPRLPACAALGTPPGRSGRCRLTRHRARVRGRAAARSRIRAEPATGRSRFVSRDRKRVPAHRVRASGWSSRWQARSAANRDRRRVRCFLGTGSHRGTRAAHSDRLPRGRLVRSILQALRRRTRMVLRERSSLQHSSTDMR